MSVVYFKCYIYILLYFYSASMDVLKADIKSMDDKVEKLIKNIDSVGKEFKKQIEGFLSVSIHLH